LGSVVTASAFPHYAATPRGPTGLAISAPAGTPAVMPTTAASSPF